MGSRMVNLTGCKGSSLHTGLVLVPQHLPSDCCLSPPSTNSWHRNQQKGRGGTATTRPPLEGGAAPLRKQFSWQLRTVGRAGCWGSRGAGPEVRCRDERAERGIGWNRTEAVGGQQGTDTPALRGLDTLAIPERTRPALPRWVGTSTQDSGHTGPACGSQAGPAGTVL